MLRVVSPGGCPAREASHTDAGDDTWELFLLVSINRRWNMNTNERFEGRINCTVRHHARIRHHWQQGIQSIQSIFCDLSSEVRSTPPLGRYFNSRPHPGFFKTREVFVCQKQNPTLWGSSTVVARVDYDIFVHPTPNYGVLKVNFLSGKKRRFVLAVPAVASERVALRDSACEMLFTKCESTFFALKLFPVSC